MAAQNLGRRWIGIDISANAIDIIQDRRLGPLRIQAPTFGIPQDLASARKLAAERPFDFEGWAVTRIPGLALNEHQRGDGGIDGRGTLLSAPDDHASSLVLAQVKGSPRFSRSAFRDFLHVVGREEAALGIYVTQNPVNSRDARAEAAAMGEVTVGAERYPRVQLWSISDYFEAAAGAAVAGGPVDGRGDAHGAADVLVGVGARRAVWCERLFVYLIRFDPSARRHALNGVHKLE